MRHVDGHLATRELLHDRRQTAERPRDAAADDDRQRGREQRGDADRAHYRQVQPRARRRKLDPGLVLGQLRGPPEAVKGREQGREQPFHLHLLETDVGDAAGPALELGRVVRERRAERLAHVARHEHKERPAVQHVELEHGVLEGRVAPVDAELKLGLADVLERAREGVARFVLWRIGEELLNLRRRCLELARTPVFAREPRSATTLERAANVPFVRSTRLRTEEKRTLASLSDADGLLQLVEALAEPCRRRLEDLRRVGRAGLGEAPSFVLHRVDIRAEHESETRNVGLLRRRHVGTLEGVEPFPGGHRDHGKGDQRHERQEGDAHADRERRPAQASATVGHPAYRREERKAKHVARPMQGS